MKVLVTGDRTWVEQSPIAKELELLKAKHPEGPWILIEGGASGVDNISGYVGARLGYEVRVYPVTSQEWELLGPVAGHLRNQRMLDEEHPDKDGIPIDYVRAFHHDPGLGKGTKDMIRRARKIPELQIEITIRRRKGKS